MSNKLIPIDVLPTERLESEDDNRIEVGQWYWYSHQESRYDRDLEEYRDITYRDLVCVTHIGSNYAKVRSPYANEWRIHFNQFDQVCVRELDHKNILAQKVERHRVNVAELLDEVKEVTNRLGIVHHGEIAAQSQTTSALAVASGTADIKGHKDALVAAKKDILPDLFKKIEKEHEQMAIWMKAELIPAKAQLTAMQQSTEAIDDRIFTVELYAGLTESLVQIKDGTPAPNDTKVSLFQRRHYMDEECLLNYRAGGMDFESIKAFDKWLVKPENLNRILPLDRCIVAFRIRRASKDYGYAATLSDFIRFSDMNKLNESTFLYIRNGEQVWRLITDIDFGAQLYPDKDHSFMLNDQEQIYINERVSSPEKVVITSREMEEEIEEDARLEVKYKRAKETWDAWQLARSKALGDLGLLSHQNDDDETPVDKDASYIIQRAKRYVYDNDYHPDREDLKPRIDAAIAALRKADEGFEMRNGYVVVDGQVISSHWGPREDDYFGHFSDRRRGDWVPVSSETTTYYDDVMKKIHEEAKQHNRVAVVLQGLLDRSPCLHPHPPYRLWTPEGFNSGIHLVYDDSRAITDGDPLNFQEYFKQLGKSIKVGSVVIGQERAWMAQMADEEDERRSRMGRHSFDRDYYKPYGNPGPGFIAKIVKIRGGKAYFEWFKKSQKGKWVPDPDDPGYRKFIYPKVKQSFAIELDKLFNVSAYTPGDYKMFFNDPRTRGQYLQWAPFLLSAENYHADPGKYFPDKNDESDDDE